MPTAGETARALRDRPLGKVAILAVVLLVAVLVARSCGRVETDVSREQAVEIARGEIAYEPNLTQVRLLKRGLNSRPVWVVSLSQQQTDGSLRNVTVVVVDARSGEVEEIRRDDGA